MRTEHRPHLQDPVPPLVEAARAIIHQRDHFATYGAWDLSVPHPEDQEFDDWAADALETALGAA